MSYTDPCARCGYHRADCDCGKRGYLACMPMPTHRVYNDYWLMEYPKVYIPETEEDYQTALYESENELSVPAKYIRRGDNGLWQPFQQLVIGEDFDIINEVAVPKQSKP